jgi:hypothetical protein
LERRWIVTNEERIAALFAEANPVRSLDMLDPLEPLDIDPLESRSERSSVMTDVKTDRSKVQPPARWPRLALLAAVPVIALAAVFFLGDRTSNVSAPSTSAAPLAAPAPLTTAAPSTTAGPRVSPTDTTTWATYESERYGFSIGYPSNWTVRPADHDWTLAGDADDWMSSGHEAFILPYEIRVSAWSVAMDPGSTIETSADVEAWVEEYCQLSEPVCTGFNDLSVPLCLEARDCHPGLLVPFDNDVQAFFPGSTDGTSWDRMVVVAIWRAEYHRSVSPYGGARRLIEAFLSTMGVCPADDRTLC